MAKAKVITCCGDCGYYDWKKHKCKRSHNKEENAQDHFYDDCTTLDDLDRYEDMAYNKGIDDSLNAFKKVYSLTLIEEEELKEIADKLKRGGVDGN